MQIIALYDDEIRNDIEQDGSQMTESSNIAESKSVVGEYVGIMDDNDLH